VVRTRRGARLVQRGLVLSEIVDAPGPTDSLFDVLAACLAALTPGTRVAILGFAGGGLVAPLRAMGFAHPLDAVDLSLEGTRVFRDHAGPWAGEVRVEEADAVRWLRRGRRRYDAILEDLSVATPEDVTKPGVSLEVVPALLPRRLTAKGLAITNLLPVPGWTWSQLRDRVAAPFPHAVEIRLDHYENRILVASAARLDAREISRALGRHLRALGSDQAGTLAVRGR